jgi:hypothetical protein
MIKLIPRRLPRVTVPEFPVGVPVVLLAVVVDAFTVRDGIDNPGIDNPGIDNPGIE